MALRPSILIVSPDVPGFEALRLCLSDPGLTLSATHAEDAQKILESREIALLLIDLAAHGNHETLTGSALKLDSDTQVIVLAGPAESAMAQRCLKQGACDMLAKPFDPEVLRAATDRASEAYQHKRQLKRWRAAQPKPAALQLLGSSAVMRSFSERASKLAQHDATVLITGEAGTGKSRAARLIHALSQREGGRFVAFDCLATRGEDQELLLFGEEGSGILSALEAAEGGTLYLHECDSLTLTAQERLQHALKERETTRLKSKRSLRLDLRLISGTRANLRSLVHQSKFREDLYWSLCGVALEVPPLRERPGDIEELLKLFLEQSCQSLGRRAPSLPPQVLAAARSHGFPGNVSELKHLAGLLAALSEGGELSLAALPAQIMTPLSVPRSAPAGALALKPIVHEFEKQFLLRTLKAVNGNQSKAARVLDIHRNTLILKMQELGIPNKRSRVKGK
jgi:DNA-binding NtrC family response regulator